MRLCFLLTRVDARYPRPRLVVLKLAWARNKNQVITENNLLEIFI